MKMNIKIDKEKMKLVGKIAFTVLIAVGKVAAVIKDTDISVSTDCAYYSPGYSDTVAAIMRSDMLSAYKSQIVNVLKKDGNDEYYRAVINVLKSSMMSCYKYDTIRMLSGVEIAED